MVSCRPPKWLLIVLRIFFSLLFIGSALAKLVGIDQFELYVFSYGFFPLNVCFVLVRVCIAVEMWLGVMIALGWFPRTIWLLTMAMLLLFTIFLCYALLIGRHDSCQCFGQIVDFSPEQSLLKNALLIALLLPYRHACATFKPARWKLPTTLVLGIAIVVAIFAISVPDNWAFRSTDTPYNHEAFDEAMQPQGELAQLKVGEGRKLVAFVTPGCIYCKMTRQKIDYIVERHHIPTDCILYLEPTDLSSNLFLQITYGFRPLVMLVDYGNVVATFHYRNINEAHISHFLLNQSK